MGNYRNLEHDFVERTLRLIAQYETLLHKYKFEEQYNYTLLLNCLLGIIVMPKDKTFTHIPNPRITEELKREMGIVNTIINGDLIHLRDLISKLRNSIAHFDIEIISNNEQDLIDRIVFLDSDGANPQLVIDFHAEELLPFIRYYGSWLQTNLINNHGNN